jgi:transcriptional regulator
MLIHRHDGAVDDDQWRAFLARAGFGQLVAAGRGRDVAVVVPTQYVFDAQGDRVVLHLAVANPVWAALAENPMVTFSVAGDWAYIPSHWKAIGDEDPAMGIPTTYYAAVQLVGPAQPVTEGAALAALLETQLSALEPDSGHAPAEAHGRRFPAIRGLVLELAEMEVRAKFKYGGNVDAAHRDAVDALLAERDGPGDAAARRHLQRLTER